MSSLWQNPECFIYFLFSIFSSGDSASCFLEMNMPIILIGTLIQARMGVGRVTFHRNGPMRGQYVLLMAKYYTFTDFLFQLLFPQTQPFISLE